MVLHALSYTEWFVVGLIAVITVAYARRFYGEVELMTSPVDGRTYVVRMLPDRARAADLLASLNERLERLVDHMVAKFPRDPSAAQLHRNYNPAALSEGGAEIGYTSYSVNKGERIVLCLRHPDGAFVDTNVLMYVAVHELAHLMTDEVGHTPKFWANFKWLLQEAIDLKLYTKVDFAASPEPYCGITIASSVV